MSVRENNSGYLPAQKKHLVVWVANQKEMQRTKSGLFTGTDDFVLNEMMKLREGVIVYVGEDCFENFAIKSQKGDCISFRGYSGEIYQQGDDFYRIFEDKYVVALITNKS